MYQYFSSRFQDHFPEDTSEEITFHIYRTGDFTNYLFNKKWLIHRIVDKIFIQWMLFPYNHFILILYVSHTCLVEIKTHLLLCKL